METGIRSLTASDLKTVSSTNLETLGAVGATADNRLFRYVYADATNGLAIGKLGVAPAATANHVNRSLGSTSPVAVGGKTVTVAVGATAVTADQYAGCYLVVRDGTGKGQTLRVNGNSSSAGSTDITVSLADPISTALLLSDSKVDLINPFYGVVASATLSESVGVAPITIPAGNYGWVQTKGIASVLADGIITKGYGVVQSTSVAGAVAISAGNAATSQVVGVAPEATVDTKYNQILLDVK